MDLSAKKILPGVAQVLGENPSRLKRKGSPVKLICWGLADPNCILKKRCGKGNPVNIPEPSGNAPSEMLRDNRTIAVAMAKH
ncbi:MAG: hypothetical protein A3A27_02350 [Candidatus Wildermuthbacteria bacterium RIFCSPLOWO2_01_FULL_47_18]|uniref:Uncharacterized protein n=1 Tax=Candidatus Wildermuthbacteria bacterium RIFCSPLOWO2_01_FULL_47_18 TaxID=1802460 RepID=A0A1G2RJE4_9BACT|nr:MAG: hypothetical protein A3A27_02350 [Candidatus Wildermuthbacteria bacterium RIFCSPLOWO2_01_FULL_47_18]